MPVAERKRTIAKDKELIEKIRKRFTYVSKQWEDIREEAQEDMRYISGDPWDPKEKKARVDANRPCLVVDELNQYLNQVVNDVRQNKRAVKLIPIGDGANDQTATLRANIIRQIEYKSNAQSAYASGFESMVQRSYGHWRYLTRYCSDDSFDQEIYIKRIGNPDIVYPDPDCKESDYSDAEDYFVLDRMTREKFTEKYPDAEIRDFTDQHMIEAPQWILTDEIQVAEYWKVNKKRRELCLLDGENPEIVYRDEMTEEQKKLTVKKARIVQEKKICQYITNGIEILEENDWAGKYIPIVTLVGKEMWVDDGSGAKRMLFSLVRLARDPYMLYCYTRTGEAELVGMTPKTPYVGYEGQFEGHEQEWQTVNTNPIAYLQVKPITDASGQNVLPLPTRQQYSPAIEPLEALAESARRAIQSAMGLSALPTNALRLNDKSGVALEKIDEQEDKGSFHFIDNYKMAIEHGGRILNDLLDKYMDTARDVSTQTADEKHEVVRINDPEYVNPKTNQTEHNDLSKGEHEVTVSSGPSLQSQREEASEFADQLAENPNVFPLIADLVIKMKNLGPIGDEIADRLTPAQYKTKDGQPPPSPQMVQALQQKDQEAQALHALVQQHEATIQKLTDEKQAKIVDNEYKVKIEQMHNELQLALAEVNTKAQKDVVRAELEADLMQKIHVAAHEAGMQAAEQFHQKQQSQQAQAAQQEQQQSQQEQPEEQPQPQG